jgi:hypothetical protein
MNWCQRFRKSSAHTQANIVCTFIVMVATIVYVIVSARQLHVMSGQLGEMKISVAQNDTQFKLDERPYIAQTIKSTSPPNWHQYPIDSTKGQILWDWHMTNYGKSPAQNITFTQEIRLAGQSWGHYTKRQKSYASALRQCGTDRRESDSRGVVSSRRADRRQRVHPGGRMPLG